jgi:hypothetical protein
MEEIFFFEKKSIILKIFFVVRKKVVNLQSQIERDGVGPVVQLVRMPPCHGGGRGFESRPDRNYALVPLVPGHFAFRGGT